MSEATPQAALLEIAEAVGAARRALADGALIELTGLDGAVTRICEAAREMPANERPAFAEQLSALAETLDLLAIEIAHPDKATQRRRAATAYGTGEDGT